MAYNIERVPNQAGKPAILLRQAWREGKKIRKKTIANLSKFPPEVVEGFRTVLKGGVALSDISEVCSITRSLQHGHVAAILGTARKLDLERMLHRQRTRERDLALAAIVARVMAPDSKLATARRLSPETASSSLGAVMNLGPVSGNEVLDMLDWLLKRKPWIEKSLARRHLHDATLVLYDVPSSFVEGRKCPLAAFGHNRDGKKGKKQIVFGLLCASDGCPIAVEVFDGNTSDQTTVAGQLATIRERFGISRIALVGDRGMITTARVREDLEPAGLDWISALRTSDLRKLARAPRSGDDPALVPEELVPDAVAEIVSPDLPGERLMACFNPRLQEERRRKRESLLQATEKALEKIAAAVRAGTLSGVAEIGRRVGRDANRRKVEKHFDIAIEENGMTWARREEAIEAEARFDGIDVIRTSLDTITPNDAVESYNSLATVEHALRINSTDLRTGATEVHSEDHLRGQLFLCMLSYHVEWHMRRCLAPLLREDDGHCVQSFRTLLDDLSTVALNEVQLPGASKSDLPIMTTPTPLQSRAFELLGIDPQEPFA